MGVGENLHALARRGWEKQELARAVRFRLWENPQNAVHLTSNRRYTETFFYFIKPVTKVFFTGYLVLFSILQLGLSSTEPVFDN